MSAPGDIVAGKFRLERLVGRGGMGSVWRGRHLRLDMPVAIKFMEASAADAPDARMRFEREARAAAQIRSPHVVQVLDHGVDGDAPYIVMELLEGEDLGARLRRLGRMSLEDFEPILAQAARGLRRAHESGVVHRDLKPSNIFLARVDDEEIVKLLDFGVAKVRWGSLGHVTQAGTLLGSPSYMSPEQARCHAVDHRSDLWSLAVIIFRVVTGLKPFSATSVAELIIKVCIEPPPVVSEVCPGLPPELDAFFARAFQQDPERRFQSALEMASELSAIVRASAARRSAATLAAPAPPPAASHAADEAYTPSSQSGPMPAEVFMQARAALEAVESRSASLEPVLAPELSAPPEPSAPRPSAPALTTPLPGSLPPSARASVPALATPLPIPPSGPRSSVPSVVGPPPDVPAAMPAFEPDAEISPYLAGGLGGPVAGVVPLGPGEHEPSPQADEASGLTPPPFGPAVPDSNAPGGGSTLTTTSRTLNVPNPKARRILALGAIAATVTATLLLVLMLVGGSDEEPQVSSAPQIAPSVAPADRPAEPVRPASAPAADPSGAEPAVTQEPASAAPPPAPTPDAPTPDGPAATPTSAAQPAAPARPGGKWPGGSTKKGSGVVDLGY